MAPGLPSQKRRGSGRVTRITAFVVRLCYLAHVVPRRAFPISRMPALRRIDKKSRHGIAIIRY